jgi:RHH-type proline utilization regulon transcriptional repressor/proline dehydrogenase/delta 1-pyrroline-5-carboxylate dehydrogenase
VYTRKLTTDVSYLACAGRLFKHSDVIYPQFATHNAHSIASVLELAPPAPTSNFSGCMAWAGCLYAEAARQIPDFPRVRVYAPVGEHKDLLAYLVRRLLENGANTSFVNRFMDEEVPVADIVRDPISNSSAGDLCASALPVPAALYPDRRNSRGRRPGQSAEGRGAARMRLARAAGKPRRAWRGPSSMERCPRATHPVTNPADRRDVSAGTRDATPDEIAACRSTRGGAQPRGMHAEARRARAPGQGVGSARSAPREISRLLVREAGKTIRMPLPRCARPWISAATTRCRPVSNSRRRKRLEGPTGELNELSLHGRGVFACISPWNFPLAIFAGQVTAALGGRQCRGGEAGGAHAADRRALRPAVARGRCAAAGRAPGARAGPPVRRGRLRSPRACGRGHDRFDRDRAHDQSQRWRRATAPSCR